MLWFALSYVGLFRFASQPRLPLPVERVFIGRRYAHDQQQELFLMVASRLVNDQIFRASFFGECHFAR